MKKQIVLIGMIGMLLLSGCASILGSDQIDELETLTASGAVYGASFTDGTLSLNEIGAFYIGYADQNLLYYDFSTKETYYLCSKPNCSHNSSDCLRRRG